MPPSITIAPPNAVPERILAFGKAGTAKSSSLLSIARRQPDRDFWIVDNDDTYERLLVSEFADVLEVGNVHVYPVDSNDWEAQLTLAEECSARAQPGDWYAFDMMSETWDAVQGWFTQKIFAVDLADYFIDVRVKREEQREAVRVEKEKNPGTKLREPTSLRPFEGYLDWSVINPQYKKLYRTFTQASMRKVHVYATAEAALAGEDDDPLTRAQFETAGLKPKGQKRLPHVFHTCVLMEKATKRDEWHFTTCGKDRGREVVRERTLPGRVVDGEMVGPDFAKAYLMDVAGWKVRKI